MNSLIKNLKCFTACVLIQFAVSTVYAQKQQDNVSANDITLILSTKNLHDLSLKQESTGEYQIETSGSDPYLFTNKLVDQISTDRYMLSFEYFCPTWLDHLQIFFAPPLRKIKAELEVAEGWTTFSIDVKEYLSTWGRKGDFLRLDFGSAPNYKMQIRNIRFRKPTAKELEVTAKREKNKRSDAALIQKLDKYLNEKYPLFCFQCIC